MKESNFTNRNDAEFSIVIAGEAGQGIQTIELILIKLFKGAGYNVFAVKEYMSRVRGGINSTLIRVSSQRVNSFIDRIDVLFALNKEAIARLKPRISDKTIVIDENELKDKDGKAEFLNVAAAGFAAGIFKIEENFLKDFLVNFFSGKELSVVEKNLNTAERGRQAGIAYAKSHVLSVEIERNAENTKELVIDGHQAVGLGALAGGCDFISSYPMSPSTGVLTFLAEQAEAFEIIVEQAEDEISAVNMALGAWYAGARAMVTTSGGGFALMIEAVSLAGAIESPLVIHLAQRPGPATGLPTRTEQGDLELALYAGHGDFARVIYTPGNLQDAYLCACKAFETADKYQIPVFILTDQYLMDSCCNIVDLPKTQPSQKHIVKTESDYQRYVFTQSGLSPRGIAGYGSGLVCVDSDEHDQSGCINEDMDIRTAMVDKRLKKAELLKENILEPEFYGALNYKTLIIGWGSTYGTVKEAISLDLSADIGFLYFKQVYPLSEKIKDYWNKAEKIFVIENNAIGQFQRLIKREFGLVPSGHIRKYNGMPFSVEEVIKAIKE